MGEKGKNVKEPSPLWGRRNVEKRLAEQTAEQTAAEEAAEQT